MIHVCVCVCVSGGQFEDRDSDLVSFASCHILNMGVTRNMVRKVDLPLEKLFTDVIKSNMIIFLYNLEHYLLSK